MLHSFGLTVRAPEFPLVCVGKIVEKEKKAYKLRRRFLVSLTSVLPALSLSLLLSAVTVAEFLFGGGGGGCPSQVRRNPLTRWHSRRDQESELSDADCPTTQCGSRQSTYR